MSEVHSNQYANQRHHAALPPALGETFEVPPENLLQAIWFHQRLRRDQLHTLDGTPVQVLHPGFWNREPGPDFRNAVIQFGDQTPVSGDVEIDLHSSGWSAHRHDRNPAFQQVVLHVIWDGAADDRPALSLQTCLDAPLAELSLWLGSEGVPEFPTALAGRCCQPMRELADAQIVALLHEAALVRLQSKAARLHARARQAGWTQALWEALFRALGYKHNPWPMQRLAELKPHLCPEPTSLDPLSLQARLLGVGGLLPAELRGPRHASAYLRQLWDLWWRERGNFDHLILPRGTWRFGGLRPANHPERRLALAAHWWSAGDLPARLEAWCLANLNPSQLLPRLVHTLQPGPDPFWSRHWTLRSPIRPKAQPLLGPARATDLALNAILPWLWIRAREGRNTRTAQELEHRYFSWPNAEDNAVLRLARQRLFGSHNRRRFHGAAAQQGTLQVVRDYCEQSDALCTNCRFPQFVRNWITSSNPVSPNI